MAERPAAEYRVKPQGEAANTTRFQVGVNGRLSKYPLGAVADAKRGLAVGIDMARPAFYRIGYNAATGELFLAYDIALTPEKPAARIRFCTFGFDPPGASVPRWPLLRGDARAVRLAPAAMGCGCRLPRSARSEAGRISASSSRKATARPAGTTGAASTPSAIPSP